MMGTQAAIMRQGVAWIDPDSFQIIRLRLDLLVRRTDIGLDQHTTKIEFNEVRFDRLSRTLWLPREVQVVIVWRGWRFANRHYYSQYRLFTVESREDSRRIVRP